MAEFAKTETAPSLANSQQESSQGFANEPNKSSQGVRIKKAKIYKAEVSNET